MKPTTKTPYTLNALVYGTVGLSSTSFTVRRRVNILLDPGWRPIRSYERLVQRYCLYQMICQCPRLARYLNKTLTRMMALWASCTYRFEITAQTLIAYPVRPWILQHEMSFAAFPFSSLKLRRAYNTRIIEANGSQGQSHDYLSPLRCYAYLVSSSSPTASF